MDEGILWGICCILVFAAQIRGQTIATTELTTENVTEASSCNVNWDVKANSTWLRVTWSGDMDNDTPVNITVSKVCVNDSACKETPKVLTANFSDNSVHLNVSSYTMYRVDVDFQCLMNESSKTIRSLAGLPLPPTNFRCKGKSNTTVELTWDEPEDFVGPILLYVIEIKNSSMFGTGKAKSTFYSASNLTSFTNYTFRVCAETEAGAGDWSEEIAVRTDVGVPRAPRDLITEAVTNISVSLKWAEPDVSTGPINGYRIHLKNSSGEWERDTFSSNSSYTMDRLAAYVNYTFKVLAITGAGPGEWSKELNVQTDIGVPHPPTALVAKTISNTSVCLQWNEANVSTGRVLMYRLHWKNSSGEGEQDTSNNDTSYTMERLTPYVKYFFKVLGITEAGTGQWSHELEVETKVGVPNAPESFQTEKVGNTSVSVKWNEPPVSTGPILRYRIHRKSYDGEKEYDTSTNATYYTMEGLRPYTMYTFKVSGITEAGRGQWSEKLQFETKVGVPNAPESFQTEKVGNTSVSVTWNEPPVSTGPILRYRIHRKSYDGEKEYDTSTNVTYYTMEGLRPYTMYTFKVSGITEAGRGQWSDKLQFETKVGVPNAPESFETEHVGNTSVSVKWNEPSVSTGPILRYRIHRKSSYGEDEHDTSTNETYHTMEGLLPYTMYTFKLSGITEAGLGQWSENLLFQTKVGAPHAPTALQAEALRNTSVSLKWTEPSVSTGPIRGYRIHWENSSAEGEEDTGVNNISYTMDRLTSYVKYGFKVLAITEAGPGKWSNELELQTEVGVPHAPTALKQTALSNTTVVLLWEGPRVSTGPVLEYRVYWQNSSAEGELDTHTQRMSHKLDNLTPYVIYTFKVLALTRAGPGQWSEELEIQTDIGIPTAPRHLRIDRATDISLQIRWTRPEFPRAPELEYIVGWRPSDRTDLDDTEITISGDVMKETARHAITDLLPYTNYSIRVSAVTKAGRGLATPPLRFPTAIGTPRPAIIEDVEVLQQRIVKVFWSTEGAFPGPVDFSLQAWKYPDPCSKKVSAVFDKEVKGSKNSKEWAENHITIIEGLSPFGNYSFLVLLKTIVTDGVESQKSKFIQMPPEAASEPLKVMADCRSSSTQAIVRWNPPKSPNGRIYSYKIRYGTEEGQDEELSVRVDVSHICSNHSRVVSGMRPERRYHINVMAMVELVSEEGKPGRINNVCILSAGIPYLGNTSRLLATAAAHDHVVLEWTRDVFSDYMGAIIRYTVLVGRKGSLGESTGGKWADSAPPWSNFSSGTSDFYQATPPEWNPFGTDPDPLDCEMSTLEKEDNRTLLRCTVGSQKHCPNNETFCNGPLQPDTQYELKIRGFTRGGYNDTLLMYARTGPLPKKSIAGTVAAVVVLLLLVSAMAGGCYVMKRKGVLDPIENAIRSRWKPPKVTSTSGDSGLEMHASRLIKVEHFAEHVRLMMSDSHLRFSQEFEALKNDSPQLPCTIAETEENRPKNRWMNIFPFDHSRVKLLPLCDDPGSDFINANYIPGFSSPREYIASQGPLPHTVDDFWRMVWEQSVTTIVMLTQCVERGKKKCEQYWPDSGKTQYYGDLVVATMSESMFFSYVIRVLHLQLGSYERQIKQMHFTHWPDFGCPQSPADLINFVNAVRDHMPRTSTGPVLVHCSAGVGRTGTFIAVDRLSRQLSSSAHPGDNCVDIFGTVLELRNHRTNMVQTEDQYIYIHLCITKLIWERDHPQTSVESIYSNVGVSMV